MFVSAADFEIHFPGVRTLKERRQLLNKIKDRLKNNNYSVVDISQNSRVNEARLGIACCVKSYETANNLYEEIEDVLQDAGAVIISSEFQVFELEG